jgi:peptidoglycan/LPS O-acetylase OafA/YrhL
MSRQSVSIAGQPRAAEIPALNGIRALAALIVFVSHAGWQTLVPGGFGVTLFFFLSGFLITTLLRREFEKSGNVRFGLFYLRRALRLFPPMYAVMVLILLGYWLLGIGIKHDLTVGGVGSQVFYWTNYYLIFFGRDNFIPHTSIYWSLAVEEHFYLIFPLVFLFYSHRLTRQRFALGLLGACVLALVWRLVLVKGFGLDNSYTYYATDTRFDSILAGCILGVWSNPVQGDPDEGASVFLQRWKYPVIVASLAALMFSFLVRDEVFRATTRYSLQSVALFPLFWLAIRNHKSWMFCWLDWRVFRQLGTYSYVFYLSHVFIIFLVERFAGLEGVPRALVAFVSTTLFCAIMDRLLEQPLARYRATLHR